MSDLHPMYARLRTTIADQQPAPVAPTPCRHPRRQQRTERTEEVVPMSARYSHYRVAVTTTVHCDACNTVIGSETHQERRR